MKRMILVWTLLFVLAACGQKPTEPPQIVVNSPAATLAPTQPPTEKPVEAEKSDTDEALVDLTQLSSTLVYSEVYNMVNTPENYVGRTVKMRGEMAVYEGPETENGRRYYFAVVIPDATACCTQGLEFVLADVSEQPEFYPEPGAEVTIQGEFQTYMEDQWQYCHLVNAEVV